MLDRIWLAYDDGSDTARVAADLAYAIAAGRGARVTLVHVVSPPLPEDYPAWLADPHTLEVLSRAAVQHWHGTLEVVGWHAPDGVTVPLRLEYARTRPADERETAKLARLMAGRCAAVGSHVEVAGGRLVFSDRGDLPSPDRGRTSAADSSTASRSVIAALCGAGFHGCVGRRHRRGWNGA